MTITSPITRSKFNPIEIVIWIKVESKFPLFRYFLKSQIKLNLFQADSRRGSETEILDEITALKGGGRSDVETEALVKHLNWFSLNLIKNDISVIWWKCYIFQILLKRKSERYFFQIIKRDKVQTNKMLWLKMFHWSIYWKRKIIKSKICTTSTYHDPYFFREK